MRCLTTRRPLELAPRCAEKRKDGNTQKSRPAPQTPKTGRKGGQPPTIRKPGK